MAFSRKRGSVGFCHERYSPRVDPLLPQPTADRCRCNRRHDLAITKLLRQCAGRPTRQRPTVVLRQRTGQCRSLGADRRGKKGAAHRCEVPLANEAPADWPLANDARWTERTRPEWRWSRGSIAGAQRRGAESWRARLGNEAPCANGPDTGVENVPRPSAERCALAWVLVRLSERLRDPLEDNISRTIMMAKPAQNL